MNRKLQPDSNVQRIHVLHIMKRKPCLHDGTVMVDMDKNRLVDISPSGREPPDVRSSRIQLNATIISKVW